MIIMIFDIPIQRKIHNLTLNVHYICFQKALLSSLNTRYIRYRDTVVIKPFSLVTKLPYDVLNQFFSYAYALI